jgi:aspartyl-tRNA(Asn)/glutamyl-tRNA(Gln) amidotransferase subunit C
MISKEEVENVARLARLELDDAEKESLRKDISDILEYVGQVSAVTANPEEKGVPLVHNIMRADTPRDSGDQLFEKETALREAFPKEKNGFNVVRKIIQKDE